MSALSVIDAIHFNGSLGSIRLRCIDASGAWPQQLSVLVLSRQRS